MTEQSGNCDKLETEDDMLKTKSTKNRRTSNHIYHTSSLVPILKKKQREILKKEANKNVNEVSANKLISIETRSNDTTK